MPILVPPASVPICLLRAVEDVVCDKSNLLFGMRGKVAQTDVMSKIFTRKLDGCGRDVDTTELDLELRILEFSVRLGGRRMEQAVK